MGPWVCGGDFNEVCGSHDRQWGQIRDFRDAISQVGLSDLGMVGGKYHCTNRRQGGQYT